MSNVCGVAKNAHFGWSLIILASGLVAKYSGQCTFTLSRFGLLLVSVNYRRKCFIISSAVVKVVALFFFFTDCDYK